MSDTRPSDINFSVVQNTTDDGKIALVITIPASDTAKVVDQASFVLAMQNQLDLQNTNPSDLGEAVKKAVGEAQYNAFSNFLAMSALTPFVITKQKIEIIMEPEFDTREQLESNKDFTYVATVMPKPHFELSSYEPVRVKIPGVTVTEEEIDAQIDMISERAASMEAKEGAEVEANSEIVIGISTKRKGTEEEIPFLTASRRVYLVSSGFLPEEFDKGIMGMKPGEKRTFDFDAAGLPTVGGEPGEPQRATTTVTLIQVNESVAPAITDEWIEANIPDVSNMAQLRELLRKQGSEFKAAEQENMKFYATASELAKRFEGMIADEIYEHASRDMLKNTEEQLRQNNMTLEQYLQNVGIDEQQFNMEMMVQVRETLRQSFALDALARHLKLLVNEEDIQDALSKMAPGNEAKTQSDFEATGRTYLLREAAMRIKANKWLAEQAVYEIEG